MEHNDRTRIKQLSQYTRSAYENIHSCIEHGDEGLHGVVFILACLPGRRVENCGQDNGAPSASAVVDDCGAARPMSAASISQVTVLSCASEEIRGSANVAISEESRLHRCCLREATGATASSDKLGMFPT